MQKLVVAGIALVSLCAVLSGCGSVPYSKGYALLPDSVRDAHDYTRSTQKKMNKGEFAAPQLVLDNIEKRLSGSDCYRILRAYDQWGILEPETVFIGESMTDGAQGAYVFIPPVLDENKLYPTPKEDKKFKVFRIDQEAPYSAKLIATLQRLTGDRDHCVRFGKVPASEQTEMTVVAAEVVGTAYYRASSAPSVIESVPQAKPIEVKPEAKPEAKADVKPVGLTPDKK